MAGGSNVLKVRLKKGNICIKDFHIGRNYIVQMSNYFLLMCRLILGGLLYIVTAECVSDFSIGVCVCVCTYIYILAGCAFTLCKHTNCASPLSRVAHLHLIFHLFIFIYLYSHLRMLYDGSVISPGDISPK